MNKSLNLFKIITLFCLTGVISFNLYGAINVSYELLFIIDQKYNFNESTLLRPRSATIDQNENIYILDQVLGKVLVFNVQGELIKTFGAKGEGPGEFSNIATNIAYLPFSDRICVIDNGHRRVTIFTPQGEYESSFFITIPADKILEKTTGDLLISNFILEEEHKPLHIYSRDGEHIESFGSILEPRKGMFSEFTRQDQFIFSRDDKTRIRLSNNETIYYAQRSPYRVVEYDYEANIINIFSTDTPFVVESGVIKESINGGWQYDLRPSGSVMEIWKLNGHIGAIVTGPEGERFVDIFNVEGQKVNRLPFPEEPEVITFVSIINNIMVIISSAPDIYPSVYVYRLNYN